MCVLHLYFLSYILFPWDGSYLTSFSWFLMLWIQPQTFLQVFIQSAWPFFPPVSICTGWALSPSHSCPGKPFSCPGKPFWGFHRFYLMVELSFPNPGLYSAFLEQFPKKRYMEDFLFKSWNSLKLSFFSSPPLIVWLSTELKKKKLLFYIGV